MLNQRHVITSDRELIRLRAIGIDRVSIWREVTVIDRESIRYRVTNSGHENSGYYSKVNTFLGIVKTKYHLNVRGIGWYLLSVYMCVCVLEGTDIMKMRGIIVKR